MDSDLARERQQAHAYLDRLPENRDPPNGQDERVLRRQARHGVSLPCSGLHQSPASESHSQLRLLSSVIAVPW